MHWGNAVLFVWWPHNLSIHPPTHLLPALWPSFGVVIVMRWSWGVMTCQHLHHNEDKNARQHAQPHLGEGFMGPGASWGRKTHRHMSRGGGWGRHSAVWVYIAALHVLLLLQCLCTMWLAVSTYKCTFCCLDVIEDRQWRKTHTHTHLPGPCSRLPAAGVGTHPPADHRLQSWAAEAAHSTHLYKEGCGNCTECYINGGKSTGQLEHFHFFSFTLSLSKQ